LTALILDLQRISIAWTSQVIPLHNHVIALLCAQAIVSIKKRHGPFQATVWRTPTSLFSRIGQKMRTIEKQAFSIGNETIDYYVTVMTAKEIFEFSKVSRVDEDPKVGYQSF